MHPLGCSRPVSAVARKGGVQHPAEITEHIRIADKYLPYDLRGAPPAVVGPDDLCLRVVFEQAFHPINDLGLAFSVKQQGHAELFRKRNKATHQGCIHRDIYFATSLAVRLIVIVTDDELSQPIKLP